MRFKEEAGREIREYAASAGVPCYGITLGDHVNNKWTLFTNMVVALQPEQTGVPVFATIGNHDHEFPTADEKAARAKYESYFGPVDYSFNRGDVHVVSMDNVIHSCKASADYEGGFTAAQYAWLKQDLSFVPKDKMVILCVHIPFRGGWGTNSAHADADKYYDEVLDLLSQYEYAAIMSAHTHSNINHIHTKNGKEIFEHITGTSCGAWWRSTVCTEGTPIGFGIYRIDGAADEGVDLQNRCSTTKSSRSGSTAVPTNSPAAATLRTTSRRKTPARSSRTSGTGTPLGPSMSMKTARKPAP